MDRELYRNLAKTGRQAARSREMNHLGKLWLEMISQVAEIGAPELDR
jgi:hypothetical protein